MYDHSRSGIRSKKQEKFNVHIGDGMTWHVYGRIYWKIRDSLINKLITKNL